MTSSQYIRSSPTIPRDNQPFYLNRTRLAKRWFIIPAVWIGGSACLAISPDTRQVLAWDGITILVVTMAFFYLVTAWLKFRRESEATMAADSMGVWIREQRADPLAVYIPWDHIESIFFIESHRKPVLGTEWLITIRVRHLPAALRRSSDPVDGLSTFQVSTYLSNYSHEQARVALADLAAGRCPVA